METISSVFTHAKTLDKNWDSLFLSGSHAYGMATRNSDIDVRGFALRTKRNILLSKDYSSKRSSKYDIVIYTFDKFVQMLKNGNPNTIEFLGLLDEYPNEIGDIGSLIQENKHLFLTKNIGEKFSGYVRHELHFLKEQTGKKPDKILAKKQYHIVRLSRMGTTALTQGIVETNRKLAGDAEELCAIKNGAFIKNSKPTHDWNLLADYEYKNLVIAEQNSLLPNIDNQAIEDFIVSVNERAFRE